MLNSTPIDFTGLLIRVKFSMCVNGLQTRGHSQKTGLPFPVRKIGTRRYSVQVFEILRNTVFLLMYSEMNDSLLAISRTHWGVLEIF